VAAGVLGLLWLRRGPDSRWPVALASVLVVTALIDYGVAWVGLTAGTVVWLLAGILRRYDPAWTPALAAEWRERFERGPVWAPLVGLLRPDLRNEVPEALRARIAASPIHLLTLVGAMLVLGGRQLLLLVAGMLAAAPILRDPFHPLREIGVVLALVAARVAVGIADLLLTIPGRRQLRAGLARARRFEFWPTWLIYLGMADLFVRRTFEAGHPLAFTACNPGIENGGGSVGESKSGIMHAMRRDAVDAGLPRALADACCRTWVIQPCARGEPDIRAAEVDLLVGDPANGLAYPVVLKPDAGYRGFSVRVVRTREDCERYFAIVPGPVIVQPWHPGPGEVGVLWVRGGEKEAPVKKGGQALAGRIFSVTFKDFARLEGDGERTIEELVWRHPRYRLQARTFLARFAGRRLDVPGAGEVIALGLAGNHCQGALFRDGAHMITPELEAAVDALCASFRGLAPAGTKGLDMARLDVRYRSEQDLRAGWLDADSVVELNGTLGETTNIYDPDKPLSWSYGYLRGQWTLLYALGRARMKDGGRGMSLPGFLRLLARNGVMRKGSALAD
jgi:hypothetical protein